MKRVEPDQNVHPEALLDLWMGNPESPPAPGRPPTIAIVAGVIGAVVGVTLLLKYAVDALAILLALVAVGLILHVLGIRLAESDILSPGWFLIIVLGVTLLAYTVFVPADSVAGLGRYMPKWALAALEWSESKGWGQRMLVAPGSGGSTPTSTSAAGDSSSVGETAAGSSATSGRVEVILTASATAVLEGLPVTLMARVANGSDTPSSVRFYDGPTFLGAADVKAEGRARLAYLTVRGLSVGPHDIRAETVGRLGLGSGGSERLRLAILRRAR